VLQDLEIEVENVPHYIKGGNVVFIGPQKSITIGEFSGTNLFAIAFSPCFYERSTKDSMFLNSQLFYNYNSDIFVAPFYNKDEMRVVFLERMESFRLKDKSLYLTAAHNAIERLMLDAFLHIPVEEMENDYKFEYLYVVNKFKVLLQRDYKIAKKVSYYASELNVTPRKLTEMTEYIMKKSAKQIIIEKLVSEFEKAIHFTNLTISEISYELGFSDEGNFSNFIKKHTGKNPSEMR